MQLSCCYIQNFDSLVICRSFLVQKGQSLSDYQTYHSRISLYLTL